MLAARRARADHRPELHAAHPSRHDRALRARTSSRRSAGRRTCVAATSSSATTATSAGSTSTTSASSRRSSWTASRSRTPSSMAHHVDVGGGTPGSIGLWREQIQEGLIIPPIRLMREGVIDETFLRLLALQRALAARDRGRPAGPARGRHDRPPAPRRASSSSAAPRTSGSGIDDLLDYTHRRTIAVARVPAERDAFEQVDYLDDDGMSDEPVRVGARRSTVDEDRVIFDLTGSDEPAAVVDQRDERRRALRVRLRAALPDRPRHPGQRRLLPGDRGPDAAGLDLRSEAPGGDRRRSRHGRAAVRDRAPGVRGDPARRAAGGLQGLDDEHLLRRREPAHRRAVRLLRDAGRRLWRARRPRRPGRRAAAHAQNTENAPIEETESNYPVLYRRYALQSDSEGPGRWRGGLGLRRDYEFEGPVTFSIMTERVRFAPQGLLGGGPARSNHFIRDPDGDNERLPSKFTVDLPAGGVFSIQTAGGGGYGPVSERDPEAVRADVSSGRISAARAHEVYGVEPSSERLPRRDRHRRHVHRRRPDRRRHRRALVRQGAHDAGRPERGILPRARWRARPRPASRSPSSARCSTRPRSRRTPSSPAPAARPR